jgi:hypothetical protein
VLKQIGSEFMTDIKTETVYFEKKGSQNTDQTLSLALSRARKLGIKQIVLASNSGSTGFKAAKIFDKEQIIIVTHSTGFRKVGEQELPTEVKTELESKNNIAVLTTTHAFGGVGRGVRMKLDTYQVDEVIAYTLRTFSQGVKVGCELVIMAADTGLLDMDKEVIAIGGSGTGADTAMVIKPAHAQNYLDLKVLEIICKPRYG